MISVILPIYNVEPYLEKCLNSILTNTYRDLEVICVNDGSTDGCPAILRKWSEKDSRIIVLNQENKGLACARNSGLDAATGEYVAFIDSDDWVHPRYFQSMLNCMEHMKADVVVCECRKFSLGEEVEIDSIIKPHYRKLNAKQFYNGGYTRYMIWAKLLRRKDIENIRFDPSVHSLIDTLYNLRVVANIMEPKVYVTDAQMYYYLQRPGSLVRSHTYEEMTQIAEWYVKKGREQSIDKNNKWAWQVLLQSITITLFCRYQAYLWGNQGVVRHANNLLRIMVVDLIRNQNIDAGKKAALLTMYCFPSTYRLYRKRIDPEFKDFEHGIRMKRPNGRNTKSIS